MAETLLTVEQTAERLQLHQITVRRQIARGQIRAIRKGRSVRVPESALMENAPLAKTQAATILQAMKGNDYRKRNEAILTLARADSETRRLVFAVVQKETADLPEDDDLDAWRALDSEPILEGED